MIVHFEKSGFEGTFSCCKKTLILFIEAVYRGELRLLRCISDFPASDDLRKLPVHVSSRKVSLSVSRILTAWRIWDFLKNLSGSSVFLPSMTFREFILFVREKVFAVCHLNSVSQATQAAGIVANILSTTPSNVIFFLTMTYLSVIVSGCWICLVQFFGKAFISSNAF